MDDEDNDSAEILSQRTFSVGATLGRGVHWIVSLFHAVALSMWSAMLSVPLFIARALGLLWDLVIHKPAQWFNDLDFTPLYRLVPYAMAALALYAAWSAVKGGYISSLIPSGPAHAPVYQPPSVKPPADVAGLTDRLLRLENALHSLSVDNERSRTYIEGDAREQVRLAGRLSALQGQLEKELSSALNLEDKLKAWTSQSMQVVRQEISLLHAQLDEREEQQHRVDQPQDKEARAKLRALEERIGTVEGGVKEALESGKHTTDEDPVSGIPTWLKNAITGKTAVTIESTDGQDVSGLINELVQSAMKKASRDTLARPDYAMYSSGANVIPSLTSDTYEVKPQGLTNSFLGLFTGHGSAVGRPPVTALHHEKHNGYCWPFPGSQGQLGVMLASPTRISDVTIDHVSRDEATDMRSAPRHMELWGLVEGTDNTAKYKMWTEQRAIQREEARIEAELSGEPFVDEEDEYPETLPSSSPFMRIASFAYNAHSSDEVQTFAVPQEIQDLNLDFGIVALLVKSNWGREDFTCLYRFRVHGERADGMPAILPPDAA